MRSNQAMIRHADRARDGANPWHEPKRIKIWRVHGLLQAQAYTDGGDYLYEPAPKKAPGVKLFRRLPGGRTHTEPCKGGAV
jgi:hypothetical protein